MVRINDAPLDEKSSSSLTNFYRIMRTVLQSHTEPYLSEIRATSRNQRNHRFHHQIKGHQSGQRVSSNGSGHSPLC